MAGKGICEKTITCESVIKIIKMVEADLRMYTEFLMDHAKRHEGMLMHCCHRDESVNKVSELISKLEEVKAFMKSHVHVFDKANMIREVTAFTKPHVHATDEAGNAEAEEEEEEEVENEEVTVAKASLRATPGRLMRRLKQKPIPALRNSDDDRDSGVGRSATSQDMKGKVMAVSSSNTASSGHPDIATERNFNSKQCSTCDDNRYQQENAKCRSKQLTKVLGINDDKNEKHREQDYSNVDVESQTHLKTAYDTNSDTVHPKNDSAMNEDDNRKSH